jgi:manganese/iron transport system permease protein
MLGFFLSPLQFEFMQRGMLAAVFVSVLCAVIGCFVVVRGMAFLGDALAHSVLPGIAIAYLVGGNLTIGALCAAVVVAAGVGLFSRKGTLREDTAIGILFSSSLALGIALISSIRSYATDLSHILFGNLLGVRSADLVWIIILGSAVTLVLLISYRPFLLITFDPVLAATLRLPIEFFRILFLILMAITIVLSLQAIGVALVTAMLVTPAATAYLLTRRFPSMIALSAVCGAVSGVVGMYASYYWNIVSGSAVVLAATVLFLLSFLFSPKSGFLKRLLLVRRRS